MKQTKQLLLALGLLATQQLFAQNIGINTTSPNAALDINGDLALRSADISISDQYNYALDVNGVKQSNYKLLNAMAVPGNFILTGIKESVDGRVITIYNKTGHSMEVYNDEQISTQPADRILTGTGATLAIYNNGTISLSYDIAQQKWVVVNTHNGSLDNFGGGGAAGVWDLNGSDINNNNTGNVGVGIANPTRAKFEVQGVAGLTTAMFGGDGSGISFQKNWPTIGLNQYREAAAGFGKAIADGFGVNMNMNPANGVFSILMLQNALANQEFPSQNIAINIFANGKVHIGDNNITDQATLSISGGSNFPSHFNFGSSGDTYIRGGNRERYTFLGNTYVPSKVYINDITGSNPNLFPSPVLKGGDVILALGGGNVGVGVDNPKSKLSFANELGNKINFWQVSNTQEYGIGLQSGTLQIYTAGQDQIAFGYGNSANFNRTMTYYPGSAQLGINTLPVPGYHLSVKGIAKFQELVVEVANWPDYVFKPDYKLPSLAQISDQIKTKGHLSGIPSAMEIETSGLKVGEVQRKMMEKIEELTLYILELKGEIDLLKINK